MLFELFIKFTNDAVAAVAHPFLVPVLFSPSFISLTSSHLPLLCGCAPERAAAVYLSELPISAYCQWKPRKPITKLIVVPGVECMLCVRVPMGALYTHTHPLSLSSSLTSCDASHMVSRQAAK